VYTNLYAKFKNNLKIISRNLEINWRFRSLLKLAWGIIGIIGIISRSPITDYRLPADDVIPTNSDEVEQ